jgi:hypothetical protein
LPQKIARNLICEFVAFFVVLIHGSGVIGVDLHFPQFSASNSIDLGVILSIFGSFP